MRRALARCKRLNKRSRSWSESFTAVALLLWPQCVAQVVPHVLVTVVSVGDAALEGRAQRALPVALQQLVQPLDVARPHARPPVRQLGQVLQRYAADPEQVLALEIALGTLARHRRDVLRAVLGERRFRPRLETAARAAPRSARPRCARARGTGTSSPRCRSPPGASSTGACRARPCRSVRRTPGRAAPTRPARS